MTFQPNGRKKGGLASREDQVERASENPTPREKPETGLHQGVRNGPVRQARCKVIICHPLPKRQCLTKLLQSGYSMQLREVVHAWGHRVCGNSLYQPLKFALRLKLLSTIKFIF